MCMHNRPGLSITEQARGKKIEYDPLSYCERCKFPSRILYLVRWSPNYEQTRECWLCGDCCWAVNHNG
jgi:hypothetical protein